jgi:hypothetical protein
MSDLDVLYFTPPVNGRMARGDTVVAYRDDVAVGSLTALYSGGVIWRFSLGQCIDGNHEAPCERISEAKAALTARFERWCSESAGLKIDGPSRVPSRGEGTHDQPETDQASG